MKKKVFITGISGCVGHYLFDLLADHPDYDLHLLVRDTNKLKFNPSAFNNVHIIRNDLKNVANHAALIAEMEYLIHLAADWGGNEGNYEYSLSLFNLLDPAACKKVIYFSTASILDADNQPIKEAETSGTHYIRGKYLFSQKLPELKIYPNIITLSPTWVLGGDNMHPYSHASRGILELRSWLWILRFLTVDIRFHYIHAKDIALIAKYMLENNPHEKSYVLGNPAITASQFIKETASFFNCPVYFQLPVPLGMARFTAPLVGKPLHPWDLFCLKKKHFQHKAVNAAAFGIKSNLLSLQQILADLVHA